MAVDAGCKKKRTNLLVGALTWVVPSSSKDFGVEGGHGYVKTGSSQSGTDERGKCESVGLSAACPSNEAMIHSVVVVVV